MDSMQLKNQLAELGVDVENASMGSTGTRTSPAITLMPGRVNTGTIYAPALADPSNDRPEWEAADGQLFGITFDRAVLTGIDYQVAQKKDRSGPNPMVIGTIALVNCVVGRMDGDTLVPHTDWHLIENRSKTIKFQTQGVKSALALEFMEYVKHRADFVTTSKKPAEGRSRPDNVHELQARTSVTGPAGFGEQISNGLTLVSFQIEGDTRANAESAYFFRDIYTAVERNFCKWWSEYTIGAGKAKQTPEAKSLEGDELKKFLREAGEAYARKTAPKHLGSLTGSTWGPRVPSATGTNVKDEYAATASLTRLTVENPTTGVETPFEFFAPRT